MSHVATWATPAGIERLREEWAKGTPTAEIGRRLGVSKSAIVGKAHRLELDARPSPIAGGPPGGPRASQARKVPAGAVTLPALESDRSNPGLAALDAPLAADAFPSSPAVPDAPRPIRTDTERANAILLGVAARDNKPTLPPLLSDPDGTLRNALTPPRTASALVRHLAPMPPLAAKLPLQDALPTPAARVSGRGECCWPIGMPKTPAFRSCDAPTAGRRPYCDEHSKLAFVKIRGRGEAEPAHASTGGDD